MTNFSKEAYAGGLVALGEIVQGLEYPEVKATIAKRVNRMQEMLRPVVDSYLHSTHSATQSVIANMNGPNGLG